MIEYHPFDLIERVMDAKNWCFTRTSEDEIVLTVGGQSGEYLVFFIWNSDLRAIQILCHFDIVFDQDNQNALIELVMGLNQRLWLGNFDLDRACERVLFRYTVVMPSKQEGLTEYLENVIRLVFFECERYYPSFLLLTHGGTLEEAFIMTLEVCGRA